MSKYILAFDQGTTSSRAIVFDRQGNMLSVAQKEFQQIYPRPGWVEHDADEIWSSQVGVASEAVARQGLGAHDIAAIGITNQRETTVVWNRKTGRPIHNAIVWQDRRTADFCEQLKAQGHEPTFQKKTGLIIDSYFSGTKIRWILDNVPGAREMAERGELAFGTVDSWLLWRLTDGQVHATDVTNASRTLLFNIHECRWDDELLSILDIPRSMLPEVRSSSEIYGHTADGALPEGIPIAGIAGDQHAATFGQAAHERGMAKNTYGTGCFMLLNTGSQPMPSRNKLLTTTAWKIGDRLDYALEGSVFVGGAVVQWLRDGLNFFRSSEEIEAMAASVPNSGGVMLVPAFVGLGAPYWDSYARGTMVGLTRGTTRAHIARAALESIALQSAELLHAMRQDSGLELSEMRVDGGASRNDLLMQIQADVLGVPVVRPKVTETTALGAAYLAGLAVGYWDSIDQIGQQWQAERRFEPQISADERESKLDTWKRAVERSREWEATS
ncbi:glycerol kinase GlpK [Verrucomicrobiota bacterium sgz303538]